MAHTQTITLPHLTSNPLYVSLFENVKNAPFLRQQLLDGNTEFQYAFLDASAVLGLHTGLPLANGPQQVLSVGHVLAACFRAVNYMNHNRLKSRNVHSEIVFSLSPNNNIAESFRRFGITDTTTSVLAIKVATNDSITASAVQEHLSRNVEGDSIPFSDEVKKIYKLDSPPAGGGKKGKAETKYSGALNGMVDEADERREMEVYLLGIMALKGS
ncbi:kinase binding protein CGI-121-domain-containing protein [Cryomyces antarcticus]